MPKDLIPELHDVLKLTVLRHNFSDFGDFQPYAPRTPSWRGVLQHHCEASFPEYPSNRETFLLHMADGMAANFSRHPQQIDHDKAWTVHRLWNPQAVATDLRLSTRDAIVRMLQELGEDPGFEDFYEIYRHIFRARSEDAHPGMNITTLETHVRLVGRLYRFLRESSVFKVSEQEVRDAAARGISALKELRERKKREWQIHLIRCRLSALAFPFRARDLNVFSLVHEFLKEVHGQLGNNLLFASNEELILYGDDLTILDELRELAFPRGIRLDIETKRESLDKQLLLDFKEKDDVALFPSPPAEIPLPLCELCQMKSAVREWPRDYVASAESSGEVSEGTDHLCETCFAIRCQPSRLKKLAHSADWADGDVIWARFSVDFTELYATLGRLYLAYLRSLEPATAAAKAQVRFSLVAEFQADYAAFLASLEGRLLEQFREERTETILPGFYCFKPKDGPDVFAALETFRATLADFFPAFLGDFGSPLRVSLTLCPVRYPFFEVWRMWQDQEAEIAITAVGHGRIRLDSRRLQRFLELTRFQFRRSALQGLAEISRISEQLAELRFRSQGEKGDHQTLEHLGAFLPLEIGFDGVLTLAKILGA